MLMDVLRMLIQSSLERVDESFPSIERIPEKSFRTPYNRWSKVDFPIPDCAETKLAELGLKQSLVSQTSEDCITSLGKGYGTT